MRKGSKNRDASRRSLARTFRKDMGVSENVFWEVVRKEGLGFSFRRQVPISQYILDFYCAEAGLCVEIDGELHEYRTEQDFARDEALRALGIETFRIPSLYLFDNSSSRSASILASLLEMLESRSGRSALETRNPETRKRQRRASR